MKITVSVRLHLVGCKDSTEIEVEDDLTDEELDELARDAMYELIEWGWKREGS